MILSSNSIEFALLTMAAMQARAPLAPVSPAYSVMSRDHAKLKYVFDLIRQEYSGSRAKESVRHIVDGHRIQGSEMMAEVAEKVGRLLEKPKPVLAIPAWRGRFARFFDNHPALTIRMTRLFMRDALRRQRAFKKKVESGKWPPKSR